MCADVAVQLLFFSEPETTNKNKENLVRVQKKRPEPELGPGPKKVFAEHGQHYVKGTQKDQQDPHRFIAESSPS
jgi:hypothetical protein